MSRETVVWTTSMPASRSASASSAWVASCRSPTSRMIAPWRSNLSIEHLGEHGQCLPGLLGADRERRRQAQDLLAGRADEQTALAAGVDHLGGEPIELHAEQQAAASDLDDAGEGGQAGGQQSPGRMDGREQLIVDGVADGDRRRACHRVATEGGAVIAWFEGAGPVLGDEQAAERKAVREPLGERDRVGTHLELLEAEEGTGAPDAGLNLVEHEHRSKLVGE